MTPMMQQYRDAKARHPGMVLLFRMGDFFETFEEDAELVSRVLGLTLTSRDGSIPMAGVPAKSIEVYLRRLLQAGHRVAVCDQVEDAALAKGLVKREVTRVVTPGTVTEDDLLDAGRPNHLVALVVGKDQCGLAWVDATTGEFLAADVSVSRLSDELNRLAAAECLVAESALSNMPESLRATLPAAVTGRPDWTFDADTARSALHNHFGVITLTGFGFDDRQPCLIAAGALVNYLQETLKASLAHLRRPSTLQRQQLLGARRGDSTKPGADTDVARRQSRRIAPERSRSNGDADGRAGSVRCRVVALCRKDSNRRPPRRGRRIPQSQQHPQRAASLLAEIPDLQRLTARVSTGRASPRDLAAIGRALRALPRIKAKISGRQTRLLHELESRLGLCPDLRELLDRGLTDDPPNTAKDGGVIREGYNAELDELRRLSRESKDWLARFQAQEITRTGIPTLKVGFNSVHGYYIEITHAHGAKAPAEYTRRQTLKNAERYITPELKEYEEKVLTAQDRALTLEVELFNKLRDSVAAQTQHLLETADVLAALDLLSSLAELASSRRYVRPILVEEPILEIREGRHPVLDQTLPPGTFVANDVLLGGDTGRFWLITGPNMAGKSVLIKQTALIALMAQVGSFVPAQSAKVGLVDRIFTRVGASDELTRGHSTFMVEMTEAANILNNATPRSLVILDEIGRGTSTYDGVSLAWAITEHLHDIVGCRAMFATHYHELAQLAESLTNLRNYNVQVRELDADVIFLHKIAPGSAERSYGIHVARLAGVPGPVLDRANAILSELETRHKLPESQRRPIVDPPEKPRKRKHKADDGPTLFAG